MGIVYMAAALAVVPTLLILFHRLSRTPPMPGAAPPEMPGAVAGRAGPAGPAGRDEPCAESLGAPLAMSVADEAEMWLRSRNP